LAADDIVMCVTPRLPSATNQALPMEPSLESADPWHFPNRPRSKISKRIVVVVIAALVVIGSAGGLALKISHDNEVAAQLVAAAQAQKRASDAAKAKADADAAAAKAQADADAATAATKQANGRPDAG
jgi:hypothetical protein